MFKLSLFITLLFVAAVDSYYVRVINALDDTVTLQFDSLPRFNLAFMEGSNYTTVATNTISLSVSGAANPDVLYFEPIAVPLTYFDTILLVKQNGSIKVITFNESSPMLNENSNNKVWIRMINAYMERAEFDLYPSTSTTDTPLFNHVGFLFATSYVEIDPTVSKLLLSSDSNNGNQLTLSPFLQPSTAYTIVTFNSGSALMAGLYFDRMFVQPPPTPVDNTTSSNNSTSTNNSTTVPAPETSSTPTTPDSPVPTPPTPTPSTPTTPTNPETPIPSTPTPSTPTPSTPAPQDDGNNSSRLSLSVLSVSVIIGYLLF